MSGWLLFVEDDPDDRELLLLAFKTHGLDLAVVDAADGSLAREKLLGRGEDRPVLILTDLKLPRVNGLELLEWLAERPEYGEVPKAVLTSSGAGADRDRCLALGASLYLEKPLTLDGYAGVVEALRGLLKARPQ